MEIEERVHIEPGPVWKQHEAEHLVERALGYVRSGMSIDQVGDLIREMGDEWLNEIRPRGRRLNFAMRAGILAAVNRAAESPKQTSRIVSKDKYGFPPGAGENNDRDGFVSSLKSSILPIFDDIIDNQFSPASGIRGARSAVEALKSIRMADGPYEFAILAEAVQETALNAPLRYRQGDIDRASALLIENLKFYLGVQEADRDVYSNPADITAREHWTRLKVERKIGPKNEPSFTPDQVVAMTLKNNGRVMSQEFSTHPERKGFTVKEAVRNTMGLPMNPKAELYDIVAPSIASLPILAQQSTGNQDRNPLIKIKRPNGTTKFVLPDGAIFASYEAAEKYLLSISNAAVRA